MTACTETPAGRPDLSKWHPCTHHFKRPKCHDTAYWPGKVSCGRCEAAREARRNWIASLPYWVEPCTSEQ